MHLVGAAGKIQQQSVSIGGKVVRMHVLVVPWLCWFLLIPCFCPSVVSSAVVTVLIVSLLPSCLKAVGWFRRLRKPSQIPRWLGDRGRTEHNTRRVGGNQYLSGLTEW